MVVTIGDGKVYMTDACLNGTMYWSYVPNGKVIELDGIIYYEVVPLRNGG